MALKNCEHMPGLGAKCLKCVAALVRREKRKARLEEAELWDFEAGDDALKWRQERLTKLRAEKGAKP